MIAWFIEHMSKEKKLLALFMVALAGVLLVILILLLIPPKTTESSLSGESDSVETQFDVSEPETNYNSEPPVNTGESETRKETELSIENLDFSRDTSSSIRLSWSDKFDNKVSSYEIWRCEASNPNQWVQIAEISSDGYVSGQNNSWTDTLTDNAVHQFYYRINLKLLDNSKDHAAEGKTILVSNLQVCIDPGHYLNSSTLEGEDLYGYGEGLFMMQLARELRTALEKYGVFCVLTREGDNITLGGYTNGDLDNSHISLRGQFSAGSDLFISLHTNANLDNANGYPTCNQPIGINKTLVFVNQPASRSELCVHVANEIGTRVSEVNYRYGLSTTDQFTTAIVGSFHDWSDDFNDSLDTPGAVCFRPGDNGDYYGVLRGAATVGVPGLIIEHGFHTVAEVRKVAMQGDLAQRWAEADAEGIAEAFHLVSVQ